MTDATGWIPRAAAVLAASLAAITLTACSSASSHNTATRHHSATAIGLPGLVAADLAIAPHGSTA